MGDKRISMDINKDEILYEMQNKALKFNDFQNAYYKDEVNDEDATNMTTQPFWQSMRLSKRKMQDNNVVIENRILNTDTRIRNRNSYSDGRNYVGEFTRTLKIKKNIYKNGKKIFSEKEDDICNISLIKVEGDGNQAVCPNCGNTGAISSYIDGCDYCGSKFQVNDFEEKISSYYFEENTGKKTTSAFLRSFGTTAIFTVLGNFLIVLALIILVCLEVIGGSLKAETIVSAAVMWIALSIPISFKISVATVIIFAVIGIIMVTKSKSMVENAEIVEAVIPTFNKTDFVQNLEYKFRNIHMTDNAKEVSAFANCDLSEVVAGYTDVVDCNINKVKFTNVTRDEHKYYVDFDVKMRLTRIKGKRVKFENEKIKIKMSLLKGVSDVNVGSIRQYSCPNCGSSVSLLNGGECDYCGTRLEYEKYGYIIEDYTKNGKSMDTYKAIRRNLLAIYMVVIVGILGSMFAGHDSDLYLLLHITDAMDFSHECFDNLEVLENIDSSVNLYEHDEGYVNENYFYQCEDATSSKNLYISYIEQNGYVGYKDEYGDIYYSKEYHMDEVISVYHIVAFKVSGHELVIEHSLEESDDFYGDYERIE